MATLKVQSADIRLGRDEQELIQRNMDDAVRSESRADAAASRANFARRKRIRGLLDRDLKAVGLDFASVRDEVRRQHATLDAGHVRQARKSGRGAGRRAKGPRQAVWGLTGGAERPRYDLAWTSHDVDGAPLDFRTIADPATGAIEAYAHCHDSSPRRVNAYAGVGFWYIPNRNGVLFISTHPSLNELAWTGAAWNDVAQAGQWITLGIASYLREPFTFTGWVARQTDQLFWNEDNWFDWTDHRRDRDPYSMGVYSVVDSAHYYACWIWVRAYAFGQNGGSYAGSSVRARVGAFNYALL